MSPSPNNGNDDDDDDANETAEEAAEAQCIYSNISFNRSVAALCAACIAQNARRPGVDGMFLSFSPASLTCLPAWESTGLVR